MSPLDFVVLGTVVGSVVLFGGAAVLALGWAFRSGQFDNFQQGALSIFGPDEPVGEATDAFPDARPHHAQDQSEANRDGA
jgi:cbb3-type cytochrome oxidase maturation protein